VKTTLGDKSLTLVGQITLPQPGMKASTAADTLVNI